MRYDKDNLWYMKMPKKFEQIIKDLNERYEFFYLDSLVFVMLWRKENNLQFKDWDGMGSGKYAFFRKYVATLIESFYETDIKIDHNERKFLELGYKFADWLLKTPIDSDLPIHHHAEINKEDYEK